MKIIILLNPSLNLNEKLLLKSYDKNLFNFINLNEIIYNIINKKKISNKGFYAWCKPLHNFIIKEVITNIKMSKDVILFGWILVDSEFYNKLKIELEKFTSVDIETKTENVDLLDIFDNLSFNFLDKGKTKLYSKLLYKHLENINRQYDDGILNNDNARDIKKGIFINIYFLFYPLENDIRCDWTKINTMKVKYNYYEIFSIYEKTHIPIFYTDIPSEFKPDVIQLLTKLNVHYEPIIFHRERIDMRTTNDYLQDIFWHSNIHKNYSVDVVLENSALAMYFWEKHNVNTLFNGKMFDYSEF